jgi:hypothetical protein
MDVSPAVQFSLGARLVNVFVSPGEVFTEVKASPICHANWWVPALLFLLASWCAAALMFSQPAIKQQMADMQDKAMQQQFQKQVDAGKMTQAQADQIKAQAGKFSGIGQIIGGVVSPLFMAGIIPFWGGFVLWAGGALIFKRRFEFMKGVEVVGLAMIILAVGALIKGLLVTAMGNMFASPGPILLVKDYDPTNQFHNFLVTVDVFVIWSLALRGVGLAKLSDISLPKAMAWVFGVWILITGGMFALSWGIQKAVSMMTGQH